MKKPETPRLLASELEILEMLWRSGPATIVEAQRAMPGQIGYTTVQTRLNRLCKKNAVKRSKESPARYSAAIKAEAVANGDLNILLDKVSGGRVVPLVAYLVKDRSLTASEIEELKQMIVDAESKSQKSVGKKP